MIMSAVTTVEGRLAKYGVREALAAREAAKLLRTLAGTPPSQVARMIREGNIPDTSVTPTDITAALDIYGPTMAELKGKSTVRRAPPVAVEHASMVRQQQELHMDLFFVNGRVYLLSVLVPLRYIIVHPVKSKSAVDLWPACQKHIRDPQARGIKVVAARCDGEAGIIALTSMFASEGVSLSITSREGTVPIAERTIRTIKERCRGMINTLPYQLGSGPLLDGLIIHCVQIINRLPSSTGTTRMSPRELMTGQRLSVRRAGP
jgi:hypothetical protein